MTPYAIRFTKEAVKQKQVASNPRCGKRLVGDLAGFFSLRFSYKDRVVYSVDDDSRTVFVHRTRTHYGD